MKLQTKLNGKVLEFSAHKCNRPKFNSSHRGRTWDSLMSLVIEGVEYACYIDTTWGQAHYFSIDAQWYRIPAWQTVTLNGETLTRFQSTCPEICLGYKQEVEIKKNDKEGEI